MQLAKLTLLLTAAIPGVIPMNASAEDAGHGPLIRATATASVEAPPDQVIITIGVTNQAAAAAEAGATNANVTTKVLESVKALLAAGEQVKTEGYSLNPQFSYPKPGGTPVVSGYQANNSVLVTLHDTAKVGKVIDSATHSGATNVNGISFTIKDSDALQQQAIALATKKARANAEAIASALGVNVLGVYAAETLEAGGGPRPMAMRAMAMKADAPTPIEAGSISVTASVSVTLSVR
jgi:uncharacterized protein